ncbi:MFS transporter [Simplicispira psychrophila]|uniref:MFS transporter n=1 Tax=Simplicispira psychrophila TaxID=80882 RepID=UPI0005695193|nr:MFS transporter [Simplicispira psychrophila]
MSNAPPETAPNSRYILTLLTVMSALAFMDRQILSVLIEPVKLEFGLSDLQIGLITGLGFAITFGLLGVPLGRLADRRERRGLIALCRGTGGLLAALGAASVGFWSLMFTRSGAALSDAGSTPGSMSMLADLYPPAQRSRAMSVFGTGGSIGALLALLLGSWLAENYGWRTTVVVAGAGSLLMALVLLLTVREPLRQATAHAAPAAGVRQPGAVAAIWAEPVTRWLVIGVAFTLLAAYSFGTWNIALMVRHHGLSLQQAGWISGASALSSITGSLVSGALTDRLAHRDLRWQLGVPLLGLVLSLLSGVAYLLLPAGTLLLATVLMVLFAFFLPWWAAPSYAAISMVTPSQRRATANSMVLLAGAIVGNGLGPILTGWLSDVLNASLGGDGLRYAMLGMVSMILVGIFAFFRAMRAYPQAYRNAHRA